MPRISKQAKVHVRAKLLASAAKHFAAHGLAGANINQISLDAGFAKGTVYNYFPSKKALFAAVLHSASLATLAHARGGLGQGSVRAELQALAAADVALVRRYPEVMKALLRELLAPEGAGPQVLAALAPLHQRVTALLARGQAEGCVRSDMGAPHLAQVFLGQLSMAYVQHWLGGGLAWEEMAESVTALFLDGASRPGSV